MYDVLPTAHLLLIESHLCLGHRYRLLGDFIVRLLLLLLPWPHELYHNLDVISNQSLFVHEEKRIHWPLDRPEPLVPRLSRM